MCVSAAAMAVGGQAVMGTMSAIGGYKSSQAQAGEAYRQGANAMSEGFREEALRNLEADQIKQQSIAEANNIKREAMTLRAGLVTAQSGSGVVIGEGSAQAAMDQIDSLASADVLATLYSGSDKAVNTRYSGRMAAEAGHNTYLSGIEQAKSIAKAGRTKLIGDLASVAMSTAVAANGLKAGPTPLRTTGVFTGDLPTRGGM